METSQVDHSSLYGIDLQPWVSHCKVDHAVFNGCWSSPPDPSIPMPSDGADLVLIIPVHVDDSLGITNSIPLYN